MPATIDARPRRRHHRRVGRRAARGVRRVPRAHRCRRGGGARGHERGAASGGRAGEGDARRTTSPARRQARARRALERRGADRGRAPAMRAWRSCTRASGSRPSRSRPRPATRTSTSSGCRSCRARTSSSCPRSSVCSATNGVDAPVVVGGIIPEGDRPRLLAPGVAAVYTPKDFELGRIMADIVDLVADHRANVGSIVAP